MWDRQTHTFMWTYVYNSGKDGQLSSSHGSLCQLDTIVREALIGDVEVTKENLEDFATGKVKVSQAMVPLLILWKEELQLVGMPLTMEELESLYYWLQLQRLP